MFTGIIEEVGTVEKIGGGRLSVRAEKIFSDMRIGDSIAVNGVCLTVCSFGGGVFTADVMGETVRRSSLSELSNGSKVNLERAMAADGRFGGHIVQGHVDGVGVISGIKRENNAVWIMINADKDVTSLIVEKGSVAVDGISLTAAYAGDGSFAVSVIPHTGAETTLLDKKEGSKVNIECDIVGKYIKRLMSVKEGSGNGGSAVTTELLSRYGFI